MDVAVIQFDDNVDLGLFKDPAYLSTTTPSPRAMSATLCTFMAR
jgi:hypothetical protein